MQKILFVINVDWFFVSHFLPLALEAKKRGYEVHLACAFTDKEEYLHSLGLKVHLLSISRSGTTLWREIKVMYEIYSVIKEVNPHIVEFFTIKPVLYGGIVSKFLAARKKVFYITGLGYVFIAKGLKGTFVKHLVKLLYKIALMGKNTQVITENIFDKNLIASLGVVDEKNIHIIKGAGVDVSSYRVVPELKKPLRVVMASRLLKDKGVYEFLEAARHVVSQGYEVEFLLYGDIDSSNPSSLTEEELSFIENEKVVQVLGHTSDIAEAFDGANIVVLPSYREGFPKVLIEAAAASRAVVTTDVPGCRDAVVPNETALLCRVKDANDLAEKIVQLLDDEALRHRYAQAGRTLAQKDFDIKNILQKHFGVYGEQK